MAYMLVLLCMVFTLTIVGALENRTYCYVCNENTDKRCGDTYLGVKEHLTRCAEGERYCRKVIQTYQDTKNKKTEIVVSVVRQCGREAFKNGQGGCYLAPAGKTALQNVCTCIPTPDNQENSCNSGSFLQSSIVLLISTVLSKFIF